MSEWLQDEPPRRGAGGTMTPGPMDFRGPITGPVGFRGPSRGPIGFRGPIKMTLRNQYVKNRRPFFFEITSKSQENWHFSLKTFFFWKSHQNPDKTMAFSPSVLEFTKPKMPHVGADPGPTFGSRRPCYKIQVTSFRLMISYREYSES